MVSALGERTIAMEFANGQMRFPVEQPVNLDTWLRRKLDIDPAEMNVSQNMTSAMEYVQKEEWNVANIVCHQPK